MDTDNPHVTGETKDSTPENPPPGASARDQRGRFQKGAPSANPKGRPTESHELKVLAREKSPEAIKRLLFWMRSSDPTASIAAAKELLARGYGRPEQAVTVDATITNAPEKLYPAWQDMSPVEASRIYQEMIKAPSSTRIKFADPEHSEQFYKDREAQRWHEKEMAAAGRRETPKMLVRPTPVLPAQSISSAPTPEPGIVRAALKPRGMASVSVDPGDDSVVSIVDAATLAEDVRLRHIHEHSAKPDSICPGCHHLWVIS